MSEKPLPLGRMMVETKYRGKKFPARVAIRLLAGFLVVLLGVSIMTYGFTHTLPQELSFAGPMQAVNEIQFLTDLTFPHGGETRHEQSIFNEMLDMIATAESRIVADFFLFNNLYDQSMDYPELTRQLTDALIRQKIDHPDMKVVLITDAINTFYGAYHPEHLEELKNNGIEVVITDSGIIGNSSPLYTGLWHSLFRRFGSGTDGVFPNPFDSTGPRVTLRSFLNLLNFKANHRKVLIADQEALVTSANPHDASAYHSNIAFRFSGPLVEDLLKTERDVALLSGLDPNLFPENRSVDVTGYSSPAPTRARVLTEGKIKEYLLEAIHETTEGDDIWMGQFYLSDRQVIDSLLEASERGVAIRLILDPNKDAFGMQKNGIPNRPAAGELVRQSGENIEIRWYNTQGEQFHTKLILIHHGDESVILGGSANLTSRNLDDKNLETSLKIVTPRSDSLSRDVTSFFRRIWSNRGGQYTLPYEEYAREGVFVRWVYRFQEWSGFSSF